jgi:hypothetical protein
VRFCADDDDDKDALLLADDPVISGCRGLIAQGVIDDKAKIAALIKEVDRLKLIDKKKKEKEKKKKVPKWKVEHNKIVADVEPMLATIKTFDCNRLYWLSQHMAKQKRKCLDNDTTAQSSLRNYTKWICETRNKGKLSRDVSSDKVGEEESEEESDDEEEEEEEDGKD